MKIPNPKILFFGELPGISVHGISIANKTNLKMLESAFHIDIVEDPTRIDQHDKISIIKIFDFFKINFQIVQKSISTRYEYFYLVYSLSFFGSLKSLITVIIFRLLNKGQIVLHIHRGDFFSRFYKNLIIKLTTRLIFRLVDKIIVLSETQKSEFTAAFSHTFHVLLNTVELEYPSISHTRGNCNFIYISNYLIDKGIIDLLEVFSALIPEYKNITLKTYGEFSDKGLKERIIGYDISNISVNGKITGEDKFKEISVSDCLILPSWNEGQPIVLIEAMSLGTPVIATGVGLIPELLGKEYPFITIPRDRESLRAKIIQFIESRSTSEISELLLDRYNSLYSHIEHYKALKSIFG